MDKNINELKTQWQNLGHCPLSGDAADVFRNLGHKNRLATPLQKVKRITVSLIAVCVAWIPLSLLLGEVILSRWQSLVLAGYFLVMAIADIWILHLLQRINFSTMTVIEALEGVCRVQRSRLVTKLIGIALCIPILTMMFVQFSSISHEIVVGGIIGAILGLAIGLLVDSNIRTHIKQMKQELVEAAE
ncbi:MAG: hypothetical protein NC338_06295 [Firmicutes bacterium]|nr:hypothetical protein [Bacillota bacterium]MCM1401600.1 hypothetical protein [Bacteroides sp.]MCM1477238.1 hypothetical protein [Bacteroides sp.]